MPAESALSLVERLRAALDRAEEIARAALVATEWTGRGVLAAPATRDTDGHWTANGCCVEGDGFQIYDEGGHNVEQAAHIAANDPAVVLRTVAAHRKILGRHQAQDDEVAHRLGLNGIPPWCNGCGATSPCPDVRALAAVYFPEAPDA